MTSKDYYTPVRPPRGAKVSKDTSGRLMNIIAELSVSKSNDDRKRKMQQLKKDFDTSDARLVHLISGHREQLSLTMEAFSKISAKISTSRRGCRDVKEKLLACKKLLECKRDEIRRLWSESVEHREVISMLKEIEELRKVRLKVEDYLKEGNFFSATEVLVSSISLLEGKLVGVDALKDLKAELHAQREILHQVLVQELHKHLYTSPRMPSKAAGEEGKFSNRSFVGKLPAIGQSYDFSKDSDSQHNVFATILECVSTLNRLPETVEILKDGCQKELMTIVQNTSQLMYDTLQNSSYPYTYTDQAFFSGVQNSEEQHLLLDLLEAILNQFRFVALRHQSFLDNLQRIMMTKGMTDLSYYEMADIYSKLQAAVEVFVSDYLDLHNTAATHRATAAAFAKVPTVTDISSFFLRKGVTRSKKHALFKFDSSSHAINMKSYLQEQKESMREKCDLDSVDIEQSILICQPTAKNITVIFKPLKKFIDEIEFALQLDSGMHCPLHTFLMDCVKVFLDQVNIEVNRLIEKTAHSLETWKPVTDLEELKLAEARTQILNSALTLNNSLKEMEDLIYALPDYSSHFIQLVCNILQSYKDLCHAAYKGLISPDSEERRLFSVSWARDKDISRLLRSLPNWTKLQKEENIGEAQEFEESPEDIRYRNKKESDLWIQNLSCKDSISPCEIICDHNKLKNLAILHESMEWFSSQILAFAERFPDVQASMPSLLPEKFNDENEGNPEFTIGMSTKSCLKKLAKEYEDLADTCLLVLHLEVRAHCFYFLFPLSKQSSYVNRKDDQEPEPEVVRLNNDLSKIDEALTPILQPKKIKYVFEGLGELLSTILINCVSNIKKINENGVKKMGRNVFAIQQNLAGITMTREVALDRARQYFDLLNHTYEDILNQIVEEGPQFQEQEYSAVIQLLHNSREGIYEQEPLNSYLTKLRQILGKVPVSV